MRRGALIGLLTACLTACTACEKSAHQQVPVAENRQSESVDADKVTGWEGFALNHLSEQLVRFADEEYGTSKPDYGDPDNSIGTPPFTFFKRVDCEVVQLTGNEERLINRSSEVPTFHTIALLRDARSDLYAFTLTSTAPDKQVLRLQHYGPLTDQNPDVVSLPIKQRRLKDFPIDFRTGKPLNAGDGRCIYFPYPFPADQEYWLLGRQLHSDPLQGLYRNDRFRNLKELIQLVEEEVKRFENSGQSLENNPLKN